MRQCSIGNERPGSKGLDMETIISSEGRNLQQDGRPGLGDFWFTHKLAATGQP